VLILAFLILWRRVFLQRNGAWILLSSQLSPNLIDLLFGLFFEFLDSLILNIGNH